MAITPVKNTLFRFSTIRSPQFIESSRKKLGYIFHPSPENSHFLRVLSGTTEILEAHKVLQEQAKDFSAIANYKILRDINADLYDFSLWLSHNKSNLNFTDASQKANQISLLSDTELRLVWDNLFFQALQRDRPNVRQACIQLIIAQNFVLTMRGDQLQMKADELIFTPRNPEPPDAKERLRLYIKRLAHAKVVLPKVFSYRTTLLDETTELDDEARPLGLVEKTDFLKLNTIHTNEIARSRNKRLRIIKKELEQEKRNIRRGHASNKTEMFLKEREKNISPHTQKFLNKNNHQVSTITSAINRIQENLGYESKRMLGPDGLARRSLVARGHLIRSNVNDTFSYSISFLHDELSTSPAISAPMVIYLSVKASAKDSYVVDAKYALEVNSKPYTDTNIEIVNQTGKYLTLRLFPETELLIKENSVFDLECTLILSDESELTIVHSGVTSIENNNGKATIKSKGNKSKNIKLPSPPITTSNVRSSDVELHGIHNVGVTVFRRVEQEVCCYVPGEVSRIENILAREYKERHTRNLVSTEATTEITSESEVEKLSDTATSERNELQSEIATVLSQDKSTSVGASVGASGSAWGMEISAGAYADFTSSNSSSVSDSNAKSYAQEITERALERVIHKTSEKRTSKILKEFEESNKHGFDNRAGDKHVTGVYRWVDIIYTNRLVNYGKRLTYEFMVPEPAAGYKHMLELIASNDQEEGGKALTTLSEPLAPGSPEIGITGPEVFEEDTYLGFARAYGVSIPAPSPFTKTVSAGFSPPTQPEMKDRAYPFELMIPPEYEAVSADVNIDFQYKYSKTWNDKTKFNLDVGDESFTFPFRNTQKKDGFRNYDETEEFEFTRSWHSTLPITVSCKNINHFSLNVVADLEWSQSAKEAWQNEAYDIVMRAYEEQLKQYNSELASLEAEQQNVDETEQQTNNRQFNRSVEKRELKRVCIEMLTKPFGFVMGHDFYFRGNCSAKLKQTHFLEKYTSHVKFFEQAFDWETMAYLFYPYYWTDECSWKDIIQTDFSPDSIFQAFLQSGMARITVPVRPGFEDAVMYYMETGDIWNGGDLLLDADDELYISIAEELQEIEGVVEEEWQTRVPTSLTIVQADSVVLQEGGLPCCEGVVGENENSFKKTSEVIKRANT